MKRREQRVYKRGKARLRYKKFFIRGVVFFFLLGSVAFFGKKFYNYINEKVFVRLSLFEIKQFEINSEESYLEEKLAPFLDQYIGKGIFFSATKLKQGITSRCPEVGGIKIRRLPGGKVVLSLRLKEPVALCEENNTLLNETSKVNSFHTAVDEEGKFFPLYTVIELPLVYKEEKNLNLAVSFLNWLKKEDTSLYQKIKKIYTSEEGQLVFILKSRDKIIWGEEVNNPEDSRALIADKKKLQHLLSVLTDLSGKKQTKSGKEKTNIINLSFYPEGGVIVQTEETFSVKK